MLYFTGIRRVIVVTWQYGVSFCFHARLADDVMDGLMLLSSYHARAYRCLKKNQTTPRPSEHPPVMGGEMSKRLGGIKRLQIQNLFMAFKQVPRCR